jgi:hypothetical protein
MSIDMLPAVAVSKLRFWHLPGDDQVLPVVRTCDNRMLFVKRREDTNGTTTYYVKDQVIGGRYRIVTGIEGVRSSVRKWDAPVPDSKTYVVVSQP